ncbi:GIY-YIG nuclease family protein [uncultured Megamonas sp.]|uniref:GIY-YIG nuclease family protein n=1 Tax=uncultured Megamonas sp. TaxID=286140 RepID=UPI00259BE2A6|nr:GIY-YIG nuclease family protein [uncultured Megamonas sp.]
MNNKGFEFKEIYKEKWFLRNWFIGIMLLFGTQNPFFNFIAFILVIFKKRSAFKYLTNNYLDIKKQSNELLESAKKQANTIIEQANLEGKRKIEALLSKNEQLNNQINHKEKLIQEIIANANSQANEKLNNINNEIDKKAFYLSEIDRLKDEINKLEKKQNNRIKKIQKLDTIQKSINGCLKKYFEFSHEPYDRTITLPAELIKDINTYAPSVILKLHNMDYKELNTAFKANEKIITELLEKYANRYTTKTNQAIYQLMVIALRSELQNVLYTLNYKKLDEALNNIREIINKYLNIARSGNQTISSTLTKFIGELEILFIDAVKIEYEYYVKKEAARQEQLALREQMRQEAEERRRLKEQEEQMKQEAAKYETEIANINEQLKTSEDDEKTKQLLAKIKELESQLNDIDKKKEEITNLQNGKAGYVYVISNLGSFGDNIFKIGMTRRLDPQERIDELGSASVPFKFDVHSFIFSNDAVQLESDLHQALENNRVNKVNNRKEFFKISIDDLENLVYKFDPAAEFNKTMVAEQYRQTLSIEEEQTQSA